MIRSDKENIWQNRYLWYKYSENKSMGMNMYERKKYTNLKVIHMYWSHIEQKQ